MDCINLKLCYITKISKIESNSQLHAGTVTAKSSCVISQRYQKLKAIHNTLGVVVYTKLVVLYN